MTTLVKPLCHVGLLKHKVSTPRPNAKITEPWYCFYSQGQDKKKKKREQSALDICKANWVTIITIKEIRMTSPSVQAGSHMLALTREFETLQWAEG